LIHGSVGIEPLEQVDSHTGCMLAMMTCVCYWNRRMVWSLSTRPITKFSDIRRPFLRQHENLVVLRTFQKAMAMAALP